jgi:hypothetical protein
MVYSKMEPTEDYENRDSGEDKDIPNINASDGKAEQTSFKSFLDHVTLSKSPKGSYSPPQKSTPQSQSSTPRAFSKPSPASMF